MGNRGFHARTGLALLLIVDELDCLIVLQIARHLRRSIHQLPITLQFGVVVIVDALDLVGSASDAPEFDLLQFAVEVAGPP